MPVRFAAAAVGVVVLVWLWGLNGAAAQQSNMPDMMKMHEQMMAGMKADRTKLDALVTEMNGAPGTRKVDAMAAVVTELVRQHTAMFDRMGQMHEQMMGGRAMMGRRGMTRGQ
ncbi:MAG: hypothetical protein HY824_13155 [Acidobacteria bacterium]|nr:hypothetical protein [Acidobacteriota bacterium]